MRILALVTLALLAFVSAGRTQEKEPLPGEPPALWRASALQRDGKVVIQIAYQDYVEPRKAVAREPMRWVAWQPVTLGETVRAFGIDGKPLEPKVVLKALAEPKLVAVFVRQYIASQPRDLADPDPYYLATLREGTIVLIVVGADIYHWKP
jgi:hypothetical protein